MLIIIDTTIWIFRFVLPFAAILILFLIHRHW
jgi:hypothetical protein